MNFLFILLAVIYFVFDFLYLKSSRVPLIPQIITNVIGFLNVIVAFQTIDPHLKEKLEEGVRVTTRNLLAFTVISNRTINPVEKAFCTFCIYLSACSPNFKSRV